MSSAVQVSPQNVVPLAEWARKRRASERKTASTWVRQAQAGKIPGAFQFGGRGPWFVNLDAYDAEVQKLSAPKTTAPDVPILTLLGKMGISEAEYDIVRRAAGL